MSASDGSASSNRRWLSAFCGGFFTARWHGAPSGGRLGFIELAGSLFGPATAWPAGLRLPGVAVIARSRQVEERICLWRLVFVIRRVGKINIGRYLDGEPGLPVSGYHPRLTFCAALSVLHFLCCTFCTVVTATRKGRLPPTTSTSALGPRWAART